MEKKVAAHPISVDFFDVAEEMLCTQNVTSLIKEFAISA